MTTFSDSLSIQTNTRSITMAQEEEFQAIDNVVGNKKLRSATTTNIKHKQNVVQNTQTQRPRSTGHEDSEKKHLYPTHNQSNLKYHMINLMQLDMMKYLVHCNINKNSKIVQMIVNLQGQLIAMLVAAVVIPSRQTSCKMAVVQNLVLNRQPHLRILHCLNYYLKEKDINTVKAVFLVNGVDKSWMSRRLQRAFDQWIMYANMLRNREMADRITISRKQEEELHGASLRKKITQEFVRVSEKISNFDRTEKKLREQNRSLNTKVLTLEEQMTKMKEANQTLKDKLGNTEKNLEQVIASRRQKGYNGNNNNNREKDDVLVNSVIDVMEDSLRVLDVDKNKNSRGNNTSGNDMMQTADVKNRNNKRPRLRSPINFNVQQQQQYSNRPSSNSRKEEEEEGQEEKGEIIEKSNSNNEQVGITMEELEKYTIKNAKSL